MSDKNVNVRVLMRNIVNTLMTLTGITLIIGAIAYFVYKNYNVAAPFITACAVFSLSALIIVVYTRTVKRIADTSKKVKAYTPPDDLPIEVWQHSCK